MSATECPICGEYNMTTGRDACTNCQPWHDAFMELVTAVQTAVRTFTDKTGDKVESLIPAYYKSGTVYVDVNLEPED